MSQPESDDHRTELREDARNAHAEYHATRSELFKSVLEFSHSSLRAVSYLNGGATLAALALIGSIIDSPMQQKTYSPLINAITWFGAGLFMASVASALGYFAQYSYQEANNKRELVWKYPYVIDTKKTVTWERFGTAFHIICIIIVSLSYASFVCGGCEFIYFAKNAMRS